VDFDVIVIGAGFAGLTAAALCARIGLSCAVFEAAAEPGGYAGGRMRAPYRFDTAVAMSAQGGAGMIFDHALRLLGVREQCEFIPIDPLYAAHYPDRRVVAPADPELFVEAHVRAFPGQRAGLSAFFELCRQIQREAHELPPTLSLEQAATAPARYPTVFEHLFSTVTDQSARLIPDAQSRAVAESMWLVMSVPPSRLSLITFGQFLSCAQQGPFYCRGGFQALVAAVATGLERHGGELLVERRVVRLLVDGERVVGVQLEDGQQVRARVVISNADGRTTYQRLLGPEMLPPSVARRLARLRPSLSTYILYAATSADLEYQAEAPVSLIFPSYDHDWSFAQVRAGRPAPLWLSVPTLVDPSLAPAGQHLVIARVPAPFEAPQPWPELAADYRSFTLDRLEAMFPDFKRRLEFVEDMTPAELASATGNAGGAAAGWEPAPDQIGSRGLAARSPVPGLYLASQWAGGFSLLRTLASGFHVAQMVGADLDVPGAGEILATPMMPAFDAFLGTPSPVV
jgi:phytoene desaturase